jgi:hypothetical protein
MSLARVLNYYHDDFLLRLPRVSDDRTLVIVAVGTSLDVDSHPLTYLAHGMRDDEEIAQAAVFRDWRAVRYVTPRLRESMRRAGPVQTRLLFRHMPQPYDLPDDLVVTHILSHIPNLRV